VTEEFAPAPAKRAAAAIAVGAESAVIALGAALYLVLGLVGEGDSQTLSLALAGLCALSAVALALLAKALWNARRWATSPSITWQVLQGLAGAYAISAGEVVVGIVALALALIAGAALAFVVRAETSAG